MDVDLVHKNMTDEEMYQMIKNDTSGMFMDAEEWKRLTMLENCRHGRGWSR